MTVGYFAQRLAGFEEYTAPVGVMPPAAAELVRADEQIDEKATELKGALSGHSPEELAEFGWKVARGELRAETVRSRIGFGGDLASAVWGQDSITDSATHNRRNFAVPAQTRRGMVVDGAIAAWRADADRGEWSDAALRKSCFPELKAVLQWWGRELVESWSELPENVKVSKRSARSRDLRGIAADLDIDTISGVELEARRRCQAAWSNFDQLDLGFALQFLSGGVHAVRSDRFTLPRIELLLLGAEGAARLAAGYALHDLVVDDLVEEFDVIADPFGEDSDQFQERLAAFNRVDEWKNALGAQRAAGVPLGRDASAVLKGRRSLSAGAVVAAMQEEGEWVA